jgi:hypothetical protein
MIKFFDKHLDFLALALKPETRVLVLEGTVRSSKTVIAIQGFFYRVYNSTAKLHLIAGRDFDTINNNILNNEMGLLTLFPQYCKLVRDEIGGYYVELKSPNGVKKILLVGYNNKTKWTKILGLSIECILVDEVNIADPQFIKECFARQISFISPITIWTLNGDVPTHYIYTEYINYCKIIGKCPASTRADMNRYEKKQGWIYTFWDFYCNPVMDEKRIQEAYSLYPPKSYYYKIKILGERGAAGTLIYNDYMDPEKLIKDLSKVQFNKNIISCDIGATRAKNSFALEGYNKDYSLVGIRGLKTFLQCGYNQKTQKLDEYYLTCREKGPIECISVDSAEQNYIRDLQTYFWNKYRVPVVGSYKATIKERIDMNIILMASARILFDDTPEGREAYDAFLVAKWAEGKEGQEREDLNLPQNDIMDCIEYGETVHMKALMFAKGEVARE